MNFLKKILMTIGLLILIAILAAIATKAMGNKVSTGGIGPFIIYPLGIAGIIAIWKKK
jgi:hypothetical protein